MQRGAVHLPDGGGDAHGGEKAKPLVERPTQGLFDERLHFGDGERGPGFGERGVRDVRRLVGVELPEADHLPDFLWQAVHGAQPCDDARAQRGIGPHRPRAHQIGREADQLDPPVEGRARARAMGHGVGAARLRA